MLIIDYNELDDLNKEKYDEFSKQINDLIAFYEKKDKERLYKIKDKISKTDGNWDIGVGLKKDDNIEKISVSTVLAYEYCLASENITNGKVEFEEMMTKLFDGVQKFRIGNPVPGKDDECLYKKSFEDMSAIPVTTKLYRMVMGAGAQHLESFKDGKFTGAVFIYSKGKIKSIAKDENGDDVDIKTDGIDFKNISKGQSLLTNLRQTAFHEWTHNSEKEKIETTKDDVIDYEYKGADEKKYRNYEKIKSYVVLDNTKELKEPQYIISNQKDERGKRKKFLVDEENKKLRPLKDVKFNLGKKDLDSEYCLSSGMTTVEITPDGKRVMHNQITEGFVEATARAMVLNIAPETQDLDITRYYEKVEIANKVFESRDKSLGDDGKTYADFLMHSSVLKKDLEGRKVDEKVDGLHYLSDFADRVHNKQTIKKEVFTSMEDICKYLGIDGNRCQQVIEENQIFNKAHISKDEISEIRQLMLQGENPDEKYVDNVIEKLVKGIDEEQEFFNGIPEKLGFREKDKEQNKVEDVEVENTEIGNKKGSPEELMDLSYEYSKRNPGKLAEEVLKNRI